MKNILIILVLLVIFLSLVLFTGIGICKAKSDSTTMQSKTNYNDRFTANEEETNWHNDENRAFRMVVMAVKQNIIERYDILDTQDEDDYLQFICETIE
jgi:hypothetical protein